MQTLYDYIESLKSDIFRALCLCDDDNPHLTKYMCNLRRRVIGAGQTFDWGHYIKQYTDILNTIQYFCVSEYTKAECRTEVLRMVNDLQRIQDRMGGDSDAH